MGKVSVQTPTVFGVGDGVTKVFSVGGTREVVDSLNVTSLYRKDANGNNRLYQNIGPLAPGSYPQYPRGVNNAICNRSTFATYIDQNGVLQTAAPNTPRYQNGSLLVEAAATNQTIYSDDLTNVGWRYNASNRLPITAAGVHFGMAFYTVSKPSTANSEAIYQQVSVLITDGQSLVTSLAVLAGNSSQCGVGLYDGASLWGDAAFSTGVAISGPGVIQQSNGAYYSITGLDPTTPTIFAISRTAKPAETLSISVYLYPDGATSSTAGANNVFGRIQSELGIVPTSYIPTATEPVTRAADQIIISDYTVS